MRREHFGLCRITILEDGELYHGIGGYPTMWGAIAALDPFQVAPVYRFPKPSQCR